MGSAERVVLDTRFLLAIPFLDERKREKVIAFHSRIRSKAVTGYVPTIVITEYFHIMSKRYGTDVAELRSRSIMETYTIVDVDEAIALEAGRILARVEVPIGDAIIGATKQRMKANFVITDDEEHFDKIGVKTKWIDQL